MPAGIYRITNTVNGKIYIGSSQDTRARWRNHRHNLRHNSHRSCHLQNAFNLDGEEAFVFDVLEECAVEELIHREQAYLDKLRPYIAELGYNLAPIAKASFRGRKHSQEARLKMSEWHKGKVVSQETRAKQSEWQTGLKRRARTEEEKQRISEAQKGVKRKAMTQEEREHLSNVTKGTKKPQRSPEHRQRLSDNKKKWWQERRESLEAGNA